VRLADWHEVELSMADENWYETLEITGDIVGVIVTVYGWQQVVALTEFWVTVKSALAIGDVNMFKVKSQKLWFTTNAGGKMEF